MLILFHQEVPIPNFTGNDNNLCSQVQRREHTYDLNILASYQNQLLMHTGRRNPLRVQYSFKSDLTLKQKKQGKNLLVESEEIKALMKLLVEVNESTSLPWFI